MYLFFHQTFQKRYEGGYSNYLLWPQKENVRILKFNIFMNFSSIFLIFWVRKYQDHKFFFPHVKSIFRPLLQRISSKNWFFEVLKMVKKWHLTWKFLIFSNIFKWVFWVSGFGFKISEAMFSTNQNVIWTYFEWFRAIWKWRIFSKISHTSEDNTRFLRIIFGGKTLQMTLSNFSKEYLTWLRN